MQGTITWAPKEECNPPIFLAIQPQVLIRLWVASLTYSSSGTKPDRQSHLFHNRPVQWVPHLQQALRTPPALPFFFRQICDSGLFPSALCQSASQFTSAGVITLPLSLASLADEFLTPCSPPSMQLNPYTSESSICSASSSLFSYTLYHGLINFPSPIPTSLDGYTGVPGYSASFDRHQSIYSFGFQFTSGWKNTVHHYGIVIAVR